MSESTSDKVLLIDNAMLRYAFCLLIGDIPNVAETERSKGTKIARWCWRRIANMQI